MSATIIRRKTPRLPAFLPNKQSSPPSPHRCWRIGSVEGRRRRRHTDRGAKVGLPHQRALSRLARCLMRKSNCRLRVTLCLLPIKLYIHTLYDAHIDLLDSARGRRASPFRNSSTREWRPAGLFDKPILPNNHWFSCDRP